jgi:hypothetical protein
MRTDGGNRWVVIVYMMLQVEDPLSVRNYSRWSGWAPRRLLLNCETDGIDFSSKSLSRPISWLLATSHQDRITRGSESPYLDTVACTE